MRWAVELEEDIQTMLEQLVVAEAGAVGFQAQVALLVVEACNQLQHLVVMDTLGVHQLLVEELVLQHLDMVEVEQVVQEEMGMVL